jgi:hypothetical protein
MECKQETYDKALEYVKMQMENSDGETDLAYYVAMVWDADPDMKAEDADVMNDYGKSTPYVKEEK